MLKSKYRLTFAPLLFLLTAALSIAGCGTQGGSSSTARLVEQYAVYKAVQGYIKGDAEKAARVVTVIDDVLQLLEGDASQATVQFAADAVRSRVDWVKLDPVDQLMLRAIIDDVETELLARISTGEIAGNSLVAVRTVLTWAKESAAMVRAT